MTSSRSGLKDATVNDKRDENNVEKQPMGEEAPGGSLRKEKKTYQCKNRVRRVEVFKPRISWLPSVSSKTN